MVASDERTFEQKKIEATTSIFKTTEDIREYSARTRLNEINPRLYPAVEF